MGNTVVINTTSRTPTIDKLVNNPSLLELQATLKSGSNAIGATIATAIEAYNKGWRLIGNTLLVLTGAFGLYIAIGLLDVVNRIPFVETTLKGVGLVMSGIFVVRNLLTKENRQQTIDWVVAYKDQIIGAQYYTERTVSAIEDSGVLTAYPPVNVPTQTSAPQHRSNGIDELRYLFLASQVELIDDANLLADCQHQTTSAGGKIGVIKADGEKCDRCWNYSPTVGKNSEQPAICDRCIDALAGKF